MVNVLINKTNIKKNDYQVLDRALTYSIQRIENSLGNINPEKKFMIITDPGREGKMRKTSRRIQRINFIPSKYNHEYYRKEIKTLIEDPLPKESKESYFIQISDFVTYIVYLYGLLVIGIDKPSNRLHLPGDNKELLTSWLDILKGSLNLDASRKNEYGIVCYPE